MGQQEIEDFLKKNRGWWTAQKISKKIGVGSGSVDNGLRKMRWNSSVLFRTYNRMGRYEYKYKKPEKELTKEEIEKIWGKFER